MKITIKIKFDDKNIENHKQAEVASLFDVLSKRFEYNILKVYNGATYPLYDNENNIIGMIEIKGI